MDLPVRLGEEHRMRPFEVCNYLLGQSNLRVMALVTPLPLPKHPGLDECTTDGTGIRIDLSNNLGYEVT